MKDIIRKTKSVCPQCLAPITAIIYEKEKRVYMHKICPDHGEFDVYLWPDADRYRWAFGLKFSGHSRIPQTRASNECPNNCGLCPNHKRKITLPEIEVTWRCNLSCPVCFMHEGTPPEDPSIEKIKYMFETIWKYDGPGVPVQITGGEPTVRDDLPNIIRTAKSVGFEVIELNTNGLVLGRDIHYLEALKDAGLTNIYLQIDGLTSQITETLRGKNVLPDKIQAIENCRLLGIPVIPSVTIVKGINDHHLSEIINFSMHNLDVIAGIAMQPAFVSGRFDVPNEKHLSVGDVADLIEHQTRGKIRATDFWPLSSMHPLCCGSTYLLGEGDDYKSFTRTFNEESYRKLFDPTSPQGSVFLDIVAKSSPSGQLPKGLPILIMEYMDAWTIDLERAEECNLAVTIENGKSIPFCVYHLTDGQGKRMFSAGGRGDHDNHT